MILRQSGVFFKRLCAIHDKGTQLKLFCLMTNLRSETNIPFHPVMKSLFRIRASLHAPFSPFTLRIVLPLKRRDEFKQA